MRVIVSGALKAAYLVLVERFERESGRHVASEFGGSMGSAPTTIPNRLARGEIADVVILAGDVLDQLMAQGLVRTGSRVDLARSGVAMAVRAGAPRPDISSVDAFKRTVLQARSLVYSMSASGTYIAGLFERLGLAEHVRAVGRQIQGEPAGAFVARGEAELAFQQMSELKPVAGIDIVGPLPDEIQCVTTFSAGIPISATEPEAGKALIAYLASPAAAGAILASGMQPA
jgi:molybdate transport system substrate-binding protein